MPQTAEWQLKIWPSRLITANSFYITVFSVPMLPMNIFKGSLFTFWLDCQL